MFVLSRQDGVFLPLCQWEKEIMSLFQLIIPAAGTDTRSGRTYHSQALYTGQLLPTVL